MPGMTLREAAVLAADGLGVLTREGQVLHYRPLEGGDHQWRYKTRGIAQQALDNVMRAIGKPARGDGLFFGAGGVRA